MANPALFADRVQETTATTGTGTITLAGAATGFQSFDAAFSSPGTCYYALLSGNGSDWETGIGTVGGSGPFTLARSLLTSSSGSLISLTGTSTVFADFPASRIPRSEFYNNLVGCPALAGFTQINIGTGGFVISQGPTSGVININSGTTAASDSKIHGVSIAAPGSTPYRVAILTQNTTMDSSGPYADFGWSDGTKYQVLGIAGQLSGGSDVFNYTTANTLSGVQSGPFVRTSNWGGVYWIGLHNDGTNLVYEWSNDGVNFITVKSNAISGNFISAATNIFVGIGAAATTPAAMAIHTYDVNGLTRAFL